MDLSIFRLWFIAELEDHVAALHEEIDELQKDLLDTKHLKGDQKSTEGHNFRGGGNEKYGKTPAFERRRSSVPLKKKSRMQQ